MHSHARLSHVTANLLPEQLQRAHMHARHLALERSLNSKSIFGILRNVEHVYWRPPAHLFNHRSSVEAPAASATSFKPVFPKLCAAAHWCAAEEAEVCGENFMFWQNLLYVTSPPLENLWRVGFYEVGVPRPNPVFIIVCRNEIKFEKRWLRLCVRQLIIIWADACWPILRTIAWAAFRIITAHVICCR